MELKEHASMMEKGTKVCTCLSAGWNSIRVAEDLAGFLQLLLRSATAQPDDALRQHMALFAAASYYATEECPSD